MSVLEVALTTTQSGRSHTRTWMKSAEAAAACNVTAETVIEWAKAGQLNATRTPGGHYRFDSAEVHALLQARQAEQEDATPANTKKAAPIVQDRGRLSCPTDRVKGATP
ncbi:helix-turn-helix domain-containing protein [Nonomuraea wenchangensis]|uniref:helix-turn-helix domain-containing protein n=1 Tax=Nonomuraea wenchangensis TaxID=568860 RepID=UPI002481DE7F|nr:helix-turn-helix domain-containing protein [Nonomuraea wenchangensis]